MGRFRPAVTLRNFSSTATCYAVPPAEFGQKQSLPLNEAIPILSQVWVLIDLANSSGNV